MIPTTNSQSPKTSWKLLCSYTNITSSLQIIRVVNIPDWYFERVVFPGQRLLFDAPPDAELEVYTSCFGQAFLLKKIVCKSLEVEQFSFN